MADRLINEWVDAKGGFFRSGNWITSASGVATLQGAMQSASNAELDNSVAATPTRLGITPVAAVFPDVSDVALLVFDTSVVGGQVMLSIPAPVQSLFVPGTLTVDPSGGIGAAVVAAAIGLLSDAAGNAAAAFVSGVKSSRRKDQ